MQIKVESREKVYLFIYFQQMSNFKSRVIDTTLSHKKI